jgi:hypothetical protein
MTDIGHRSKQTDATPPRPHLRFRVSIHLHGKSGSILFRRVRFGYSSATSCPAGRAHPGVARSADALHCLRRVDVCCVRAGKALVIQRGEGRFLLDVVPARCVRDVEEKGLGRIALTELGLKQIILTTEEIRHEPRYTNARLVWSYREISVPVGLRMHILQMLLDEGPMPLGELLKSIRSEHDPAPAVMALACADLLYLDLVSRPLSPTTIVSAAHERRFDELPCIHLAWQSSAASTRGARPYSL